MYFFFCHFIYYLFNGFLLINFLIDWVDVERAAGRYQFQVSERERDGFAQRLEQFAAARRQSEGEAR